MNILQTEDLVKGLPDQRLMQEAKKPSGEIPQFLLASEIQRRTTMRKKHQEDLPEGTVFDQIMNEGIMSTQPPMPTPGPRGPQQAPPMPQGQGLVPSNQQFPPMQDPNAAILPPGNGMARGGLVSLAGGGATAGVGSTFNIPWQGDTYKLNAAGYPTQNVAFEEFLAGRNEPLGSRITEGTTNNKISFNPDGSLRETAETGTERYFEAMRQVVDTGTLQGGKPPPAMPEINMPQLPQESMGATPPPQNMGPTNVNMSGTPQGGITDIRPPVENPYVAAMTPQGTPPNIALASLEAGAFDPARGEANVGMTDLGIGRLPTEASRAPINMYDRAAQERQAAMDRGEVMTLDKIIGEGLMGTGESGQSEGNIQQWIDGNVARGKDPSLVGPGNPLEGMTDEGYLGRVSESMFGGPVGDAIFSGVDNATGFLADLNNEADYTLRNPVDQEKAAQSAAADSLRKPNAATTKGSAPTEADLLQAKVNAATDNAGVPKSRKNPYDTGVDLKGMSEQARKDAFSSALVQLGAGIAGNDYQAGFRNAGIAQSQGVRRAQALELQHKTGEADRLAKASAWEANESDRSFGKTMKKLGLDIDLAQMRSWEQKNLNDSTRAKLDGIKTALTQLEAAIMQANTTGNPDDLPGLMKQQSQYLNMLKTIVPIEGI